VEWAVIMLGGNGLADIGIKIVEIGLGQLARPFPVNIAVDKRHWRLSQDPELGGYDVEGIGAQFLERQIGFILPGQQHVADPALYESGRRAARAAVEHRDMLVKLGYEVGGGLLAATLLGQGPTPGRQ